jgi:hypothetical protein
MNTHPPRFTRQRIDSPHVITFCADMGAKLLLARKRQRQPQPAPARLPPRDALLRLRQDLQEVENARQIYTERMQRVIDRILRPETALTGEPETTVDLWRVTLSIWQRRSEQLHAEAVSRWEPSCTSALSGSLPAAIDAALAAALAACWDSLIAQALDGLESAAALCSGQENIRPAYEAAINPATAAQVLRLHIEPPADAVLQLAVALQQLHLNREQARREAEARQFEADWRALELQLQQRREAPRCSGGLGWLVLLALVGLSG